MNISEIFILIFNFLCLLHISNPRVHRQEDGCIYSYGTVRFTCIGISSLVGRRVFIPMHVKRAIATITVYTTVFLKMNSRVSNMQKTSKI